MIQINVLQSADEVLHAFNTNRVQGDDFPLVSPGSVLVVNSDGSLTIQGTEFLEVQGSVAWSDVLTLICKNIGLSVNFEAAMEVINLGMRSV